MSPTKIKNMRERVTLDVAPDGVLWVDSRGQILMANPAIEQLTGYSENELAGQNVSVFLPASLRDRHAQNIGEYFRAPRSRAMKGMDMTLTRRDGTSLPVDIALGFWEEDGEKFAVAYIRDISERKAYEETLRHEATHDALTKLPNRWLLMNRLDQALAQAKRSGRFVALILLDLDGFKHVNDTLGHATGDELLVQVSRRLNATLRENDTLARVGGDEFVVMLPEMESENEALVVAKKFLLMFEQPYELQQQKVHVGGSFGLSFYPRDAGDAESLHRFADMAMYKAKHGGGSAYACYSPEMDQRAQEHMAIHLRLKEAISLGKLKLLYQPQFDCPSGLIDGAEALVRWHDDVLGEVSPSKFIPIAEATGLIFSLSEWVLEAACKQIAAWEAEGTPLRVAVNLSAQQFQRSTLLSEVSTALQRTGANPRLLEIEITETAVMAQPIAAIEQIKELRSLGCGVAIDDFGTGYSSLGYLKMFQLTKLKIDKEFVNGVPHNEGDVKITKSVIALANSFELKVIAEGVETQEQQTFLCDAGCNSLQGWLFSKAIEPSALSAMLTKQLAEG